MAEWKKVIVSGSVAALATVSASTGINVVGRVAATSFYGDGSNITGISGVSDNNFTTVLKNKLDNIEGTADVTDATNVTAAGALMDSELTSIANVKALNQSVVSGASPTFTATNFTDASNKRFMSNAQETLLDSVETNADVTDTANVTSAGALMDSEVTDLAGVKGVTISTLQVKPSEGAFVNGDKTKLDGISASADVNRTDAAIKSSIGVGNGKFVPAAGSSGQFLKHDGTFGTPSYSSGQRTQAEIEDFAGGLFSGNTESGITATYQAADNTVDLVVASQTDNNFTNADHSKLDGIEASATADQTAVEIINLLNSDLGGNKQIGNQASDLMTFGGSVTVTGDLTVSGTTTTVDTANLAVTDQFIELNDGGSANDGGLVVAGAGTSFGWDNSEGRWAFDKTGATADQTSITADAYASAVVVTDDANYRKNGNIRVQSNEIYIYVE